MHSRKEAQKWAETLMTSTLRTLAAGAWILLIYRCNAAVFACRAKRPARNGPRP